LSLKKVNIKEKLRKKRGNEVKEQGKGNCKQSHYFRSTRSDKAEKEVSKNILCIHNQKQLKILKIML